MQERGRWNLGRRRFGSITLVQIVCRRHGVGVEEREGTARNRLLILSHVIAAMGFPAIFKESVGYNVPLQGDSECVLVFDVLHEFARREKLPFWAEMESVSLTPRDVNGNEVLEDFERAMNLCLLYKYFEYEPLYFTSFLLFRETPQFSEPFVFQMVPVVCGGEFAFRQVVGGEMSVIVNAPRGLQKDDVVLIPPVDTPFVVKEVDEEKIVARNIAGYEKVIAKEALGDFVIVCHPPDGMFRLKPTKTKGMITGDVGVRVNMSRARMKGQMAQREFFDFGVTEFYDFDDDDVNVSVYEKMGVADEGSPQGDEGRAVYELYDNSFSQMIDEEVEDMEVRKKVKLVFGGEPMFPSPITYFEPSVWSFMSFFQFDRPHCNAQQPLYSRFLVEETEIQGAHLEIPKVIVNMNGKLKEVSANNIVPDWESSHMLPLSREKVCQYVVFYFGSLALDDLTEFFNSLRSAFANFGFGELVPLPDKPYMQVTQENFKSSTEQFFRSHPMSELLRSPILTFVVFPPGFNQEAKVRSVCNYISEDTVLRASVQDINHMAFIIYSRVRIFDASPYGVIDVSGKPRDSCSLFFGYRYQAPYLLKRNDPSDDVIRLHVCWDPVNSYSSWVDDIGSVSHMFKDRPLETASKLISEIRTLLEVQRIDVTLSVLSQSLSKDLVRELKACFQESASSFSLFSIFPAACVQVSFDSSFQDDIIVFGESEATCFNGLTDIEVPDATAFIISPGHTSYTISHYCNNSGETPQGRLHRFAQQMSHLSWLASRTSTGERVVSFPPHLASLLSKNRLETDALSRFTFLPPRTPGDAS